MSKKEKAKSFCKKHKKKLILGGVLLAVGVTAVVVSGSKKRERKQLEFTINHIGDGSKSNSDLNFLKALDAEREERIAALDWGVGTMDDLWDEDDYTNAIVNDINVSDIGLLGDEFCKIDGVSPDSEVSMIVGLRHQK